MGSDVVRLSRTKKDIIVNGLTPEDVRCAVQKWFNENKVGTIERNQSMLKGRWGSGFLTGAKYFQVTLVPVEDGTLAKTEGWVSAFGLAEEDFNASSLAFGGLPRKEGWKAIERLWSTLESLSKKP